PLEAEPEPAPKPRGGAGRAVGGGGVDSVWPTVARAKGSAKDKAARREPKCPKCGYSLVGLPGMVCPECGANIAAAVKVNERERGAREDLKRDYLRALGLMLGGWAGVTILLALRGEIGSVPLYLIEYVFMVPVGLVVFFVCSALWIGFDAPWGITAVRLAAIYALADVVGELMGFVPILFVGPAVTALAYIMLLESYLDIDKGDAIILAILTAAARLGLGLVVGGMMG
ncbi:MAG TPA: hypothetical protein VG797_00560, partial [Phycisphaerales bacterium]|nr:hypothetical protein [Phycisphaerales bacterium]